MDAPLAIADRFFESRMLVGTGKFASHLLMRQAVLASGAEIVTVALRRVDLNRIGEGDILDFVPPGCTLLPNTSGARDADEAVRLARLGRAGTGGNLVKLEVTPDPRTLAPDPVETLFAAQRLVAEGFVVLPYCSADPVLCRRLEEAGCATVMPLGAWIGSNRGLRTRDAVEVIVEQAGVPVVVDAGLGVPSDAAQAMEIGADAVLINTAIATAADPVAMARAFALATRAGRLGFLAGRGPVLDGRGPVLDGRPAEVAGQRSVPGVSADAPAEPDGPTPEHVQSVPARAAASSPLTGFLGPLP
ncbi:MAG: thiazole synthase [Frankiaceae bacterium]